MVRELINELSLDIFVLTETWMRLNDKPTNRTIINNMLPSTHSFHHLSRPRGDIGGGGVGIFLSKAFTHISMKRSSTFNTFEYLNIDFNHNREKLKFIVVYRPPSTSRCTFRQEFQDLLDTLVGEQRKTYICGDFNHWVEDPNARDAVKFLELMDTFNFTNDV
ncbi:MAG: endonuclease/exonuclease/phosphatase family protein, partial [Cyanobacteria bacterium J06553_1]